MDCYITGTGSYLPGDPIENHAMSDYMGKIPGESGIKEKILKMNGIKSRHYALDQEENATHDLYGLASLAVKDCLNGFEDTGSIGYLSAGSTNTPLVGPGLASILHARLTELGLIDQSMEINSNAGICSSAAQSIVNASRAVHLREHEAALCVGVEQPSDILKSTVIRPPNDQEEHADDIKKSKWFMSVFLRFMLSDGAGAFLIQNKPGDNGLSFKVNWTYSRSFANEAPLCMKLENRTLLLSQDVDILNRYSKNCVHESVKGAFETYADDLGSYSMVLPHLSSYFLRRMMLTVIRDMCRGSGNKVDYWTNLDKAGNTGAASIFIVLDEYSKTHELKDGEKLLLFIPESGQFNYVIVSLTVVR